MLHIHRFTKGTFNSKKRYWKPKKSDIKL